MVKIGVFFEKRNEKVERLLYVSWQDGRTDAADFSIEKGTLYA